MNDSQDILTTVSGSETHDQLYGDNEENNTDSFANGENLLEQTFHFQIKVSLQLSKEKEVSVLTRLNPDRA